MKEIIKDLGNDLVLRRSSIEDTDALAAFNSKIHADDDFDVLALAAWTRDLMIADHPTFSLQDFTIVEDVKTKQIVSSSCLISQTWTYDGVPFNVGRIELVGTLPEYRGRGLIGEQFKVIHEWSQVRGELVQAITGIPYYYRRFGYEMALNFWGGRLGYEANLVPLKQGEAEPYRIRAAVESDIDFIARLYEDGCKRSLIATKWDKALWLYQLNRLEDLDINGRWLFIIEDLEDIPCGFLAVPKLKWHEMAAITTYELIPSASYFQVTPAVARWLWQFGEEQAKKQPYPQKTFGFWLGEEHPVYAAYGDRLPKTRKPYAWYLRVPNLADFIKQIKPALERHLENSINAGYSGELKLSFYHDGLLIRFEEGKIVAVETLPGGELGKGVEQEGISAAFPGLTFIQMLFGWRSMEEISYLFPDCDWRNQEIKTLIDLLFPKKTSNLWPIS